MIICGELDTEYIIRSERIYLIWKRDRFCDWQLVDLHLDYVHLIDNFCYSFVPGDRTEIDLVINYSSVYRMKNSFQGHSSCSRPCSVALQRDAVIPPFVTITDSVHLSTALFPPLMS